MAGPTRKGVVRVGVARPIKTRAVRLGFAKMSTCVLAFTNPRVGGWPGEGGEAQVCHNEHLRARFRKSESLGWLGLQNEGREGRGGQARTVRLGFAKTSTQVLAFANSRVGGGWAYKNENGEGWGGQACKNNNSEARVCQNEHPNARFHKSDSWRVAGPTKTRVERGWPDKD